MGHFGQIGPSKAQRIFPQLDTPGVVTHYAVRLPDREKPLPNMLENILRPSSGLRATTLSLETMHHHGDLMVKYLRARRDVFIVAKRWQLPETAGMEFDQYDTPEARWIVVHERDEVLAGIRIAPTTARCGLHSYMIRDAQLGLLDGLPLDPLYEAAPVSPKIWEATRLFLLDKVPAQRRADVQRVLMLEMAAAARREGAEQVIGIVPAVFQRWLNRIGMNAVPVGPRFELDGDRSQAALFDVRGEPGAQSGSVS
ncbi:acyl-homoserine-lactone synthase [Vannielia litorea]|uniref:N-acyl-L-homoserine lactone synthetase n=1 Tax=Vannielia litorea TaxID=1217970 RepID=A0A1N6ELZ7_9RHOB|nr:acyl-homoserine-lactone synthase [Vannielia litorea]SIN84066.1 N-acyl-L-homoserine lactone synthetase [Vannielia litorea]